MKGVVLCTVYVIDICMCVCICIYMCACVRVLACMHNYLGVLFWGSTKFNIVSAVEGAVYM